MARWTTRTVGELREALASMDDQMLVSWAYEGPQECCDGHVHDITLINDCDALIDVTPGSVTVTLFGGHP